MGSDEQRRREKAGSDAHGEGQRTGPSRKRGQATLTRTKTFLRHVPTLQVAPENSGHLDARIYGACPEASRFKTSRVNTNESFAFRETVCSFMKEHPHKSPHTRAF